RRGRPAALGHAVRRTPAVLAAAILAAASCRDRSPEPPKPSADAEATPTVSGPVRVAAVGRRTLSETVSAPGHTVALAQEKIRAPFAGTLTELSVTDGDRVRAGQTVGTIVSRDSDAALIGAREMERQARRETEEAGRAPALLPAR